MYAVVLTGGKQYRVTAGDTIEVEKLSGAAGDSVKFEQILSLSGERALIGTPHVTDAFVQAQIVAQGKGDKVLIFKKKRRHNYRRKNGHRQPITTLYITGVSLGGKSLASVQPKTLSDRQAAPAPKAKKASTPKAAAATAKATTTKKPAAKKKAK